jgi:hypothetical protein
LGCSANTESHCRYRYTEAKIQVKLPPSSLSEPQLILESQSFIPATLQPHLNLLTPPCQKKKKFKHDRTNTYKHLGTHTRLALALSPHGCFNLYLIFLMHFTLSPLFIRDFLHHCFISTTSVSFFWSWL